MNSSKLEHFRQILLAMRQRVTGEVEHVVESIHEDSNPAGKNSNLPNHIGDAASEGMDANLRILATEQEMLEEIELALGRIAGGSFGKCEECGTVIKEERLETLPYTPVCVQCASEREQKRLTPTSPLSRFA